LAAIAFAVFISCYVLFIPAEQALLIGAFFAISSTWLALGSAICITVVAALLPVWTGLFLVKPAYALQMFLIVEVCMAGTFWLRRVPVSSLAERTQWKESALLVLAVRYCRTGCLVVGIAAAIASLFRAYDLITSLSWAFLFISLYFSLRITLQAVSAEPKPVKKSTHPKSRPSDLKPRSRILNIALLTVSILLCLALLEVAASLSIPPFCPPMVSYMYSPQYLFLPRPNVEFRYPVSVSKSETKETVYHMSSIGFRDREYGEKEPGEYRILMLGDSFTVGHAVTNDSDTIPKLLEPILAQNGSSILIIVGYSL
jgi:hypothetical protein